MRIAQCIVYSLKWQRGIDLVWSLTDNRQAGIDGGTARELVRSLFDAKKKKGTHEQRGQLDNITTVVGTSCL